MPSSFSHAVAAIAIGRTTSDRKLPLRFWVLSVACSLAPDLDILGPRLGIDYRSMLGHRGLTHSLPFALLLSGLVVLLAFWRSDIGIGRGRLLAYFFVVTASHVFLDAMVDGVWGVAIFAPFSATRYFLPWRPIHSSPLGLQFFGTTGAAVILNEVAWVWVPSIMLIVAPWMRKRLASKTDEQQAEARV